MTRTLREIAVTWPERRTVYFAGGSCAVCEAEAPEPPHAVLVEASRDHPHGARLGVGHRGAAEREWMPPGWGHHPDVGVLCPACLAAARDALERRRLALRLVASSGEFAGAVLTALPRVASSGHLSVDAAATAARAMNAWQATAMDRAVRAALDRGLPESMLVLEHTHDPPGSRLMCATRGPSGAVADRVELARTWVRWEPNPEGAPSVAVLYQGIEIDPPPQIEPPGTTEE